jgi:hypothetical protein
MAGLDPAIHVFAALKEDVDSRVKPAHDGVWGTYAALAFASSSAYIATSSFHARAMLGRLRMLP